MNHASISSLFEKEGSLNYSILDYGSTLKSDEQFTEWQLAEYLLDKDPHYRNYWKGSNMNRANRIETIVKTVKRHVKSLEKAHLIIQTGTQKETKGTASIPNYALTPAGRVIFRILRSLKMEDPHAEKEILSILQEHMFKRGDHSHSFIKFSSKLTANMCEKGFFTRYVSILREGIKSKGIDDIVSFASTIQKTVSIGLNNPLLCSLIIGSTACINLIAPNKLVSK